MLSGGILVVSMSNSREMLVALIVGAVIISGSLYVSASNTNIEGEVTAQPAPEKQYIKPVDSDGDGIDDWAEELLADRAVISAQLNPDEPYAAPSTLTEKFSVSFFQQYLYAKGLGDFSYDRDELVAKATEVLKREATDRVYDYNDIILSERDDISAIHAYGNRMAEIVLNYSNPPGDDEVSIVQKAMNQNDPERLAELDPIIESYKNYLEQTLITPAPPSLKREHVDIINVYNAILNDLMAMRQTFDDPLLGLLRLKRYNEDVEGLAYVAFNLELSLRKFGVTYKDDEPAAMFSQLSDLRNIVR